jgi:hypothetical protein
MFNGLKLASPLAVPLCCSCRPLICQTHRCPGICQRWLMRFVSMKVPQFPSAMPMVRPKMMVPKFGFKRVCTRRTGGSVLSLPVPSRHVALYDPGEFICCTYQSLADNLGVRSRLTDSALPSTPPSASGGFWYFVATLVCIATTCRVARLLWRIDQKFPGRPRLLLLGFQVGHPPRRRV